MGDTLDTSGVGGAGEPGDREQVAGSETAVTGAGDARMGLPP